MNEYISCHIKSYIYIHDIICAYLSTISSKLPGTTHPRRTKLRPAAANSSFSVGYPWRSRASDGGFHGHGVSKKGWFIINGTCHEHWWFGGRPISGNHHIWYLSVTCIEYLGSLGIACHATMQQLQHRIGWDVFGITESKSRNLSRSKVTNSEVVWDQKNLWCGSVHGIICCRDSYTLNPTAMEYPQSGPKQKERDGGCYGFPIAICVTQDVNL